MLAEKNTPTSSGLNALMRCIDDDNSKASPRFATVVTYALALTLSGALEEQHEE